MPQRCPMKFEHKVALISGLSLKISAQLVHWNQGMSVTGSIYSASLACFWPLLPRASCSPAKFDPNVDEICSFCSEATDDLCHYFYDCRLYFHFWNSVKDWLGHKFNIGNIDEYINIKMALIHDLKFQTKK